MQNNEISQWSWMMDWCKRNKLHPGESWVWQAAEQAYADSTKEINSISDTSDNGNGIKTMLPI